MAAPRRRREAALEDLARRLGRRSEDLAGAIDEAGGDLVAGVERLGGDLTAAFGPSGRPDRGLQRLLASRPSSVARRAARRTPDPLPRSLRRAADRPAVRRGKRPNQRLIDAANAGILTRSNTRSGTAGRRAVDAVTYDRRQERARVAARRRGEPAPSARAAAGHSYRGARFFGVPTTSGLADIAVTSRREASRVGLYLHDVGDLVWGEVSDRAFAAKWGRRVRSAGGFELQPDPAKVRALLRTEPPPPVRYERRGAW